VNKSAYCNQIHRKICLLLSVLKRILKKVENEKRKKEYKLSEFIFWRFFKNLCRSNQMIHLRADYLCEVFPNKNHLGFRKQFLFTKKKWRFGYDLKNRFGETLLPHSLTHFQQVS
jgi:hypothetical protein